MLEKQIFEFNDKKNSQIIYLQKLSRTSNTIYNFILISVICIIISLPFIRVKLTTAAPASIQSELLKETFTAPFAGKISLLNIYNNRHVTKGKTIVAINNSSTENEMDITKKREELVKQYLHDINSLETNKTNNKQPILYTLQYQSEYSRFSAQQADLNATYENEKQVYNRFASLFQGKAISVSEFEQHQLSYKHAKSELELLRSRSYSQWQTEQYQLNQELNNLTLKENQLKETVRNSFIVSNISGTGYVEDGIQLGVFVQAGQKLAQIIPNVNLIVECLVAPKDIGFIKVGESVQVQIDSYNYYEWGMAQGVVFEINKDVIMVDNKPVYLVKCKINKNFLTLKNGYKAMLIKGMTGRANFYLSSRTVWQLLSDDMNDWLNPNSN